MHINHPNVYIQTCVFRLKEVACFLGNSALESFKCRMTYIASVLDEGIKILEKFTNDFFCSRPLRRFLNPEKNYHALQLCRNRKKPTQFYNSSIVIWLCFESFSELSSRRCQQKLQLLWMLSINHRRRACKNSRNLNNGPGDWEQMLIDRRGVQWMARKFA